MKAFIALFLITALSCVPNDSAEKNSQKEEAPVRRIDLESKFRHAVKHLDHGQNELRTKSVTVHEYPDSFAVTLKATLKGDIYFSARLVVDAAHRQWEANFGDFCGDHSMKETELTFRIDKKNVSNALFMFSGSCGEWLAKDIPGQSNLFFQATDLKFLNERNKKAEQDAP